VRSARIIGAGLIGTSIGLALRRSGRWAVDFEDIDPSRVETARAMCVTDAAPGDVAVVIVAVPPRATADVCAAALERFPGAVVTDVCSVKSDLLQHLGGRGVPLDRFVGGHPMGGREVSGPESGRADLLDDRVWVLTPTGETSSAALDAVRDLITDCRALPLQMDADAHDAAVAVTSHVPQVLASALAALLLDLAPDQVRVSGQGLRDMTRLAGSDPLLWSQILSANAGPVHAALEQLTGRLQGLTTALAGGDGPAASAALIGAGREGRERIPGKHGGASSDYDVVPVLIADEPGQLAAVFVAAGAAGFNLEDVRIDHVLGRPSGLVEVAVRPGLGVALAAALRERGFDVRV
jgi:prephenate dehydrogenase